MSSFHHLVKVPFWLERKLSWGTSLCRAKWQYQQESPERGRRVRWHPWQKTERFARLRSALPVGEVTYLTSTRSPGWVNQDLRSVAVCLARAQVLQWGGRARN